MAEEDSACLLDGHDAVLRENGKGGAGLHHQKERARMSDDSTAT